MDMFKSLVAGIAGLAFATLAQAAPITAGNVVIYRVGDGAAALSGAAAAVSLDEYTPTGTFVQSIALPSTGTGALTAIGNSTTEGLISISGDGNRLVFSGYRADAGTASPNVGTIHKVLGSVDISGTPNLINSISDGGTGAPRSATTTDGSIYYLGTSTGVRYVGTPAVGGTSTVIDTRNSRQVNLYSNVLYAANGSTTIAAKVQTYGTLPTGTTTGTAAVTLATTDAVQGFAAFDLNAGVAGVDTMYLVSTVEALVRKYSFDGTNWNAVGSIAAGTVQDITGVVNGTDVNLFLTSGSGLFALTDTTGSAGTLTGSLGTAIATPGTNQAFRGVGILSVPEPTSLAAVGLGAMALLRRRRGN